MTAAITATSASDVLNPTTVAPSISPHTHAKRRRQDPRHGAEPAAADQPLPGTDDRPGDQPGHQSGDGVVDPTGNRTAGQTGNRKGEEPGRPDQP